MASDKKNKNKKDNNQRGEWRFDESVLSCCPLTKKFPGQYLPVKSILKTEKHKGSTPFEKQRALCVDGVEIIMAKSEGRNRRSTTDMAIGVTKINSADKRIRLVECKFDVKNTNRKTIEDLIDKDKKTRLYFDFGRIILPYFVVLLGNDKYYQQEMRFIKNGFMNSPDCEVMTVQGFYDLYFK